MSANTATGVPAHVPPALVFGFDQFTDPEFHERPFEVLRRVRAQAPPIFFIRPAQPFFPRGTWCMTRAEDVREALQHPEIFTREDIMGESPFSRRMVPLELEAPEHGKYRAILNPVFSPKAVDRMDHDVRAICADLIDRIAESGECEFLRDFAHPFPVTVFMKLMGLPMQMQATFVEWVHVAHTAQTREDAMAGTKVVADYLREALAERRRSPRDDLISAIAHAKVDGRPIDPDYAHDMCFLLFLAGLDTVTAGLMHIFSWLASHPDRKQELIDEPALIPNAIEELLRYHAWVPSQRTVKKDVEFRGVTMKYGDHVHLPLGFPSNDPALLADAERIDFRRESIAHFAFASGVHRCAGSHLARRELRVAVAEWLRRMPDFHLQPGTGVRYVTTLMFQPQALHLRWTPGRR